MRKFLIVSRLTEEGGVMTALKALKLARAARLNVTLHIYGRGESSYVAALRSFAVTHQLPVEFLTVSNLNTDLAAVYKRHDVLLHTPEWAEPFPVTPLEAMACGLPVIGSTAGGAEELLRHGENALTYPPGDAAQLAARIQELQISPALRCQMAETAQAEVHGKIQRHGGDGPGGKFPDRLPGANQLKEKLAQGAIPGRIAPLSSLLSRATVSWTNHQDSELPMTNSQWTSASSVEPQILDCRPGVTPHVFSGLKIGN